MIVGLASHQKFMCIHHFYSGKCTKGDKCINSHEFQKKDLVHKNEKKIIQVQAKQILELENQIQEQNRIIQTLQLQTVSEKPVVCESSTTVINEGLTGETDKETNEEDKIYSPALSSELEGSCESSALVELQVAAHASISNESGWTRDNSKASTHNLRNTKYQQDKRQQYSPSHADAIAYFNFSMKMGQEMCKANPDMDGEKMQAIISKKWPWAVLPEKDKEKRRNSPKSNT